MSYDDNWTAECPFCQTPVLTGDAERATMVGNEWWHRACVDQAKQEAAEADREYMQLVEDDE